MTADTALAQDATRPAAEAAAPDVDTAAEVATDEVLVHEVSIDGMCGVY
jgi:mycofactocin precursor